MSVHGLVKLISQESPEFRPLLAAAASQPPAERFVVGLTGSHKSALAAALYEEMPTHLKDGRQMLVVTYNQYQAERWREDLSVLTRNPDEVLVFPPVETLPHEEVAVSADLATERLTVLERMARRRSGIVIAPIQSLVEKLIPAQVFVEHILHLQRQGRIDLEEISRRLAVMGYERVPKVEAKGQFAIRGDILDVFPFTQLRPVRVELFGDEVDSIRAFDVNTQRSEDEMEAVTVPPAREVLLPQPTLEEGLRRIRRAGENQAARLLAAGQGEQSRALSERVAQHLERLEQHGYFEGIEQYKALLFPELSLLVDYIPDGVVVVDEPARMREHFNAIESEIRDSFAGLLERGRVLPAEMELFASWPELMAGFRKKPVLYFSLLAKRVQGMGHGDQLTVASKPAEVFHGKLELLAKELRRRQKSRQRVVLVLANPERVERVAEALQAEDVTAVPASRGIDGSELRPGNVIVTTGPLEMGFEHAGLKLLVLTDTEVFGRQKRRRRARAGDDGVRISDYLELREGDYVVHINHGIGQYLGVQTLEVAGVHRDYLVVKYAGEDKLYVPTDQVDLLQRYIGLEDHPPKLSKLGGNEWARVKKRVKESVQEIAQGLLQLYAERETVKGYAFSPDTVWQREFEDAFVYEETPDQLRAIEEVKRDMESPRPMDRLLCGDVGYGKTEVAIRAAFKAVMDGLQVVVLVPTTILAQQHHRTFKERFEGYPVRVQMLSRFESPAEQAAVIQGLADGSVDIVIGTHRLLSRDVEFKNLGLVIVDEEQRFGVMQKERLKELRKSVDVLTLTATPIPRTLHMALTGVRDMSVIETPPEGRFPIRTYVVEYNDDLIRDAIMRELAREGQVYFVYNRVQGIERMAAHLQQLVPEARIAVAHGQMDEAKLERVMLDFLQGEYDVLLCTTIIETGMDIANVNTLVVYDADRMGLAQLYQLRGRVGRTNRVAYAYFTYRRDKILTEEAEKRLSAIKEFTDLGSGFRIAMRDLEIRGAGNLLGPEQHGFIASVGFELYCKLLEESVKELKGQAVQQPPEPVIDLNVDAYIAESYVGDSRQKVELYKKIAAVRDLEGARELAEEIEDRFGAPPEPVRNLLAVARIKVLARQLGVASIGMERDVLVVRMHAGLSLPAADTLVMLTRKHRGRLTFVPGRVNQIKLRARDLGDAELLELLEQVLSQLAEAWTAAAVR